MMMRWDKGRADIEHMISAGEIQRVPASRDHADLLIGQAHQALVSADDIAGRDPRLAYCAVYDAARLALTAILENQGLRPTTHGGHVAVYEAVRAQLDPPKGPQLRPFNEMRRLRNQIEYPATGIALPDAHEVLDVIPLAETIIGIAEAVLDQMDVF